MLGNQISRMNSSTSVRKNKILNFAACPLIVIGCHERTALFPSMDHMDNVRKCSVMHRVIQRDGLSWTVNGASTHARQLVAVLQFSTRSTGWLAWATLRTLINSSHVLFWYTWSAGAFAFTQTAYLLKLVIPTTNALPRWRLNVETKTKRTLHGSRRLF